jgi:hypothetical protein
VTLDDAIADCPSQWVALIVFRGDGAKAPGATKVIVITASNWRMTLWNVEAAPKYATQREPRSFKGTINRPPNIIRPKIRGRNSP